MRAFGKGYEEFAERIKAEGTFVRARPHRQGRRGGRPDGHQGRGHRQRPHGRLPGRHGDPGRRAGTRPRDRPSWPQMLGIGRDADGWFSELDYNADPTDTERGGIFVAGACQAPKDIPDTVAQASAVAAGVLKSIATGRGLDSRAELSLSDIEARAAQSRPGLRRIEHGDPRQSQADRRARGLRGAGRLQVLPLRQLLGDLPLLQGAVHLPAALRCAPCRWGSRTKLESSLEPWLCYYCGECSEECPRDAEPGETMMSLRRWLTSALRLHRHLPAVLPVGEDRAAGRHHRGALLTGLRLRAVGAVAGAASTSYDGPNAFLPSVEHPHLRLGPGRRAARLAGHQLRADVVVHDRARQEASTCPLAPTSRRSTCCRCTSSPRCATRSASSKRPWVIHLCLMLSYVTMLVLIMFFLGDMAVGTRRSTGGCTCSATWPRSGCWGRRSSRSAGRLKKTEAQYKHSHETDWIFLVLLIVRGLHRHPAVHVLHRAGLDVAANITYVVHLMGVVPDAGARSAVQQVVAPGLPSAGDVLRRGAAPRPMPAAEKRESPSAPPQAA